MQYYLWLTDIRQNLFHDILDGHVNVETVVLITLARALGVGVHAGVACLVFFGLISSSFYRPSDSSSRVCGQRVVGLKIGHPKIERICGSRVFAVYIYIPSLQSEIQNTQSLTRMAKSKLQLIVAIPDPTVCTDTKIVAVPTTISMTIDCPFEIQALQRRLNKPLLLIYNLLFWSIAQTAIMSDGAI